MDYIEDLALLPSYATAHFPSPVSKLDRRHTGRLGKRDNFLTGEGGSGDGAKFIQRRESLVLYNTLNTLWL
jgi:hypothetical protein